MTPLRLGIIASHGGSNLQAIIDAAKTGRLHAVPCVVISNNGDSYALRRARNEEIPAYHLSARTHAEPEALDEAILQALVTHAVEVVVLAGYMKKLGPRTLHHFSGRILNIHPALLPKYGGQGMYGRHVHEVVLAAGEKNSGVTIHLVGEDYDTGPIIAQCEVPVCAGDTADTLAERALQREHTFYVETLQGISAGSIKLPGLIMELS
ncbi:MAG TPA: phosphoribosylglycinamide formyltransferase [Armatimonadota bacterium]|jgi:phosphoribosylglycinamide formyltransferase-1